MKKITLLLFCVLSTTVLLAQRPKSLPITISGKVVDAETNQPLEYATIVLTSLKTKKVSGGITDEKGNFSIKTPKGSYDISVELFLLKPYNYPHKHYQKIKILVLSNCLKMKVIWMR